jgi:hypothetical protein
VRVQVTEFIFKATSDNRCSPFTSMSLELSSWNHFNITFTFAISRSRRASRPARRADRAA